MAGFVEPDMQASPLRERTQIEVAIMIDVNRDDRNNPDGQLENLRRRAGEVDHDVRRRGARKIDRIQHAVAVEVGRNRGASRVRRDKQRGREERGEGPDLSRNSLRFDVHRDLLILVHNLWQRWRFPPPWQASCFYIESECENVPILIGAPGYSGLV